MNRNPSIELQKYYVGPNGSNSLIRHVIAIEDSQVSYICYSRIDGGSIGGGTIEWKTMDRWIGGEAPAEDIARCHISEQDKFEAIRQDQLSRHFAKRHLSNPEVISNEELIEEVKRRGLLWRTENIQ